MLRAFIDETGNSPNDFAFVFAGWVSSVEEWERFSVAWMRELHRKPSIGHFKHSEAKSQTGEFEGWSHSDCDQKILSLAKVIVKHDLYGVITGLRHEVINILLKGAILPQKMVRSILHASRPYDWCFHCIIAMVLQYQVNLGEAEKVDFIFDEGDSAFEDCAAMFREYRDKWPLPPAMKAIMGTVTTGDDKALMPLQAADLLAGQSTVKLRRKQEMEEPYKLLRKEKRIFFSPIRWGEDPALTNFPEIIQLLNAYWQARAKK